MTKTDHPGGRLRNLLKQAMAGNQHMPLRMLIDPPPRVPTRTNGSNYTAEVHWYQIGGKERYRSGRNPPPKHFTNRGRLVWIDNSRYPPKLPAGQARMKREAGLL